MFLPEPREMAERDGTDAADQDGGWAADMGRGGKRTGVVSPDELKRVREYHGIARDDRRPGLDRQLRADGDIIVVGGIGQNVARCFPPDIRERRSGSIDPNMHHAMG
jgi:hypothetical protein